MSHQRSIGGLHLFFITDIQIGVVNYKLYKLEIIKEFESQWDVTVDKFDLQDNKHVKGLYVIKTFWVLAGFYQKIHFL